MFVRPGLSARDGARRIEARRRERREGSMVWSEVGRLWGRREV